MKHQPRPTLHAVILAALLAVPALPAAGADPAVTPLRPVNRCLDMTRSRETYVPDERTIIVKTGPNHYRIHLAADCPGLNAGNLRFLLAPGERPLMRLCGDMGGKVLNSTGLACPISGMEVIDKELFDTLQAQSRERRR